jgi:hypothetical protein
MNDDRKELKLIQEKLDQLSTKQLELVEQHQQQPFYYRWLATPDPKLDAINSQIADLKRREGRIYNILEVQEYLTLERSVCFSSGKGLVKYSALLETLD